MEAEISALCKIGFFDIIPRDYYFGIIKQKCENLLRKTDIDYWDHTQHYKPFIPFQHHIMGQRVYTIDPTWKSSVKQTIARGIRTSHPKVHPKILYGDSDSVFLEIPPPNADFDGDDLNVFPPKPDEPIMSRRERKKYREAKLKVEEHNQEFEDVKTQILKFFPNKN